jgi:regulator of sirC expression with transglutaminase-like and TPR domain
MSSALVFAAPTPLDYFAALVADDESLPLTEAAIALAQDDHPDLDVQVVLARIDELARTLRTRLPADAAGLQKLRLLNHYFFDELGFAGNANDYYAVDNSYLHRVIESRRGIPISLAVLYLELAQQIGLVARGVSFPGHFLVKLRLQTAQQVGEVILDPFTGHSLSRDQLEEMLRPYRRERGLVGDDEVPLGLFLQSASPRMVLARMLRNLKEIHRSARDHRRALDVSRRLVLLLPDDWQELRDRGLAQADLGLEREARADLARYLEHMPDAVDREAVATALVRLAPDGRGPGSASRGRRLH